MFDYPLFVYSLLDNAVIGWTLFISMLMASAWLMHRLVIAKDKWYWYIIFFIEFIALMTTNAILFLKLILGASF